MKLTDTAIKNAKGRDKPYKMFDGQGLFLPRKPEWSERLAVQISIQRQGKIGFVRFLPGSVTGKGTGSPQGCP